MNYNNNNNISLYKSDQKKQNYSVSPLRNITFSSSPDKVGNNVQNSIILNSTNNHKNMGN